MKQDHGVPALLSLFFPGLGQLVKGQWERTVAVWSVIFIPLGVFVIAAERVTTSAEYALHADNIFLVMLKSPFLSIWGFLVVIVWVWSIVDAYRRPV